MGLVQSGRSREKELQSWIVEDEKSPLAYVGAHTNKHSHTRAYYARILQDFLFFAVTSVTLHVHKRFYDDENSTFTHPKNDTSVEEKQRIVFNKMTCHFQQNNVSFSIKQRIVFRKTSRRDYDAIDPFRFKANNFHGSPSV